MSTISCFETNVFILSSWTLTSEEIDFIYGMGLQIIQLLNRPLSYRTLKNNEITTPNKIVLLNGCNK